MSDNWVKVYSSSYSHIIEIVKGLLAEHGIKAVEVNKTDSMHTHLTNAGIDVFVKEDHYLRAKHLIQKNQL